MYCFQIHSFISFFALTAAALKTILLLELAKGTHAAIQLYGTGGAGTSSSVLYDIDKDTGVSQVIGPVVTVSGAQITVNGLTCDPTDETFLYGHASRMSPNSPNSLLKINRTTGVATVIGGPPSTCTGALAGIAADNTGQLYSWCEAGDRLVTIDKITGVDAFAGADPNIDTYSHGYAFDDSNVMHFLNGDGRHYTIDTSTGLATNVGSPGLPYPVSHGDILPGTTKFYSVGKTNFGGSPGEMVPWDVVSNVVNTPIVTNPLISNLFTLAFCEVSCPQFTRVFASIRVYVAPPFDESLEPSHNALSFHPSSGPLVEVPTETPISRLGAEATSTSTARAISFCSKVPPLGRVWVWTFTFARK
jgi:hypothetical protein